MILSVFMITVAYVAIQMLTVIMRVAIVGAIVRNAHVVLQYVFPTIKIKRRKKKMHELEPV